jgi:hypothetical protein
MTGPVSERGAEQTNAAPRMRVPAPPAPHQCRRAMSRSVGSRAEYRRSFSPMCVAAQWRALVPQYLRSCSPQIATREIAAMLSAKVPRLWASNFP